MATSKEWEKFMGCIGLRLAATLALAICGESAVAQTTVIHAGHLIAEPGKPATADKSIVIEKGKIVAIKDGFVAGDSVIELRDSWVMPGLIDMHTHVSGIEKLDEPAAGQLALFFISRPAEAVLNSLPRVNALLMNGFTTVRNVGDPTLTTYALRDAINAGIVPGPRMFVTEAQISVAGGDFDPSNWDVRSDVEKFVSNRGNCSGAVECTKVVREEVRRGADVVKFRQSGLPAIDPKIEMVESPEEVRAVINTAHQLNRRVAAHVVGTPAYLHLVIEAGADTIEHGPLDDVSISMMKKRGTAYTPTLLAGKLIDYRFQDGMDGVGKAYRAGVPIIFGTDLGIFGPERSHEEFGLLAQAGMPPEQVLKAATINAAAALGNLGENLGSLAPGKLADVIAMKIDPLTHIDQLAEPGKVSFVMKEGKVFKDER
jgi:imidazolonepropionase-like amidohydrolase